MTFGGRKNLRKRVLEALFDGPRSLTELVQEVGASRQGVINVLKRLREEGLVEKEEGKRGKYYLTPNGYREYHDRRANKLIYDVYCDLKLDFDPVLSLLPHAFDFDELDLPSPCPFRVRLTVSEDLERKFARERAFASHEDIKNYTPEDTVKWLVRPFINTFVWDLIIDRLFTLANYEKHTGEKLSIEEIRKFLRFSFKLSISFDFEPSDRVMRIVSAALVLKNLSGLEASGSVSFVDVVRLLERLGWAPEGWANLMREATRLEVIEDKHTLMAKWKNRDEKVAYDLLMEAIKVLQKEGKIDSETVRDLKEIMRRGEA